MSILRLGGGTKATTSREELRRLIARAQADGVSGTFHSERLLPGLAGLQQLVDRMQLMMDAAGRDEWIRDFAEGLVSHLPSGDSLAEVNTIYDWLASELSDAPRYQLDPYGVQRIVNPRTVLQKKSPSTARTGWSYRALSCNHSGYRRGSPPVISTSTTTHRRATTTRTSRSWSTASGSGSTRSSRCWVRMSAPATGCRKSNARSIRRMGVAS